MDPFTAETSGKQVRYVLDTYLTETNTPSALRCTVKLSELTVTHFWFQVELLDGTNSVAFARADNYGWGTMIGPASAQQALISSALERLERQLQKGGLNPKTIP